MSREPPPSAGDPPEGLVSPTLDERIFRAIESLDHPEAVRLATEGITLYPKDPRYHIDRAAANVFLKNFLEAIADSKEALRLDQDHKIHRALPYLHLGRALIGLADFDLAFTIADEGLMIDPGDRRLKQCQELARVGGISKRAAALGSGGTRQNNFGDTFDGGEMWLKLEWDAEARGYRHDPEFRSKVSEARKDILKLGKHLREDKRLLKALGILSNVRFRENIGGVEPEAGFERPKPEDDKEPWLDKLCHDMILTAVDYGLPDLKNLCPSLEEQERRAEEAEEAELAKELLKLAMQGATIVEEEEAHKESSQIDVIS